MSLFDFWRWFLAVACTVYALVVTARWAYGWYEYLVRPGRATDLARRYLWLSVLRLRVRRFAGELLQIALLAGGMAALLWLDSHQMARH